MSSLAVIILAHDEALHIARALDAVAPLAQEVFVVDSGSTDDTAAIARAKGATVLQHRFVNYAQQFQWALDNAPIKSEWILRLDADEIVEPDLARALAAALPAYPRDVVGLSVNRKHIFLGRWIKHGGRYPLHLLRIWRRGHGRIENRWMDEHMIVSGGRVVEIEGGFADHNLNDISYFTLKHNKYATREAVDRLIEEFNLSPQDEGVDSGGGGRQAMTKRSWKRSLYNRLPFGAGPLLYFLWRYFAQAGFLDGREGLIYHVLQGFWYRFLVEARLLELRRCISPLASPAEIKAQLSRLTGLAVD
jgi:glycosyltransferase involved in cell wall biosynthesis